MKWGKKKGFPKKKLESYLIYIGSVVQSLFLKTALDLDLISQDSVPMATTLEVSSPALLNLHPHEQVNETQN